MGNDAARDRGLFSPSPQGRGDPRNSSTVEGDSRQMSGTVSLTTTDQQMRLTGRWVDCTISRCPESELGELASEIGHLIDVLSSLVERRR